METIVIAVGAVIAVLLCSVVVMLIVLLKRRQVSENPELGEIKRELESVKCSADKIMTIADRSEHLQTLSLQIQKERLDEVSRSLLRLDETVGQKMDVLRESLSRSVESMSKNNEIQLDKMRDVVDEKLTKSIEGKLMQSYEIISNRLEAVYKGLGEMQGLAQDTRELKNVLTNVKKRGTWGEIQLDSILEQMLNQSQYVRSFAVDEKTAERVDFAIKFPSKDNNGDIYLPIDAKFPMEEYERIISASEKADKDSLAKAIKGLEQRVKDEAKSISAKYVRPPKTTDFAIMYVPLESLYAEILRIDGMFDVLQNKYRVTVCGPTTIGALLNSLQMGFKTIQIENRSKELWDLLAVFKSEFLRFAEILVKTQKKLSEAGDTMELMQRRTNKINHSLENVDNYLIEDN